jgi:hypothetical protein
MQTFMPYENFEEVAMTLDPRRLGNQRVEALTIHRTLIGERKGWANHPAVLMWRGYEQALCVYGAVMCAYWKHAFGYSDNLEGYFVENMGNYEEFEPPAWVQDPRVHISHRSNLIRKDPEWYGRLWPDLQSDLAYFWPVSNAMS